MIDARRFTIVQIVICSNLWNYIIFSRSLRKWAEKTFKRMHNICRDLQKSPSLPYTTETESHETRTMVYFVCLPNYQICRPAGRLIGWVWGCGAPAGKTNQDLFNVVQAILRFPVAPSCLCLVAFIP